MRFLPYLDDIVPHEPGARAEPVMQRFELGAIVRDGARISRRGWARASVGPVLVSTSYSTDRAP